MTSIYTVVWIRERRVISKSFTKLAVAVAYARDIVSDQSPVATVLRYSAPGVSALNCLAFAHDTRPWWEERAVCGAYRQKKQKTEVGA